MNNKFFPGAVLFIIAFVLSNLASVAEVKAQNTFYGNGAGQNTTTGEKDSAFGIAALHFNTSGSQNTASGDSALYSNTTGYENTASGDSALYSNTTGSYNIALGYQAGVNLTTGDNNINIGNSGVAGEANTHPHRHERHADKCVHRGH